MDLLTSGGGTQRIAEYPRRARESAREMWDSWQPAPPAKPLSNAAIAGLGLLAVALAAGCYYGPDLVRYIKISRM